MLYEGVITKPVYRVLTGLTQENRPEIALSVALKELLRLKLNEAREQQQTFESKYGVSFDSFKRAWNADEIEDRYSYQVERDYWEWEAAVTDESRLSEMAMQLL